MQFTVEEKNFNHRGKHKVFKQKWHELLQTLIVWVNFPFIAYFFQVLEGKHVCTINLTVSFFSFPSTRNVPAGHSALSPPPYDFGLMFLSSQVSNYFLILVLVTSDNRKSPKILASRVPQNIESANQYSNQMH